MLYMMSGCLLFSIILAACVLTCFASHKNKMQSDVVGDQIVGHTNYLRRFYWKIALTVQEECRRYLYNELNSHEYHNEQHRFLRDQMALDIGNITRMWLTYREREYTDLCYWYEAFKLAKRILISYNEIKEAFNNQESTILNNYYYTVATQCQQLSFNTADPQHTVDISLLLTNGSGFGKFMGRSESPSTWCCDFLERVDGYTHRLDFAYEKRSVSTNVRYCDVVAIWNDSKFLKNEGTTMRWDAYTWSEKVKWKIEPFCHDPTNDRTISRCDLVTFRTLNPYELDGYYLVYSTTSQTKRNGVFAVWHPDGNIPHYTHLGS